MKIDLLYKRGAAMQKNGEQQQPQEIDLSTLGIDLEKPAEKTFHPWGCLVSIQLFKQEKSPGGIALPESAQESGVTTPRARVVAIGPDVKYVREGDIILLGIGPGGRPQGVIHKGNLVGMIREEMIWGWEPREGESFGDLNKSIKEQTPQNHPKYVYEKTAGECGIKVGADTLQELRELIAYIEEEPKEPINENPPEEEELVGWKQEAKEKGW